MQVLKARVTYMTDKGGASFANDPYLSVLVDAMPAVADLRYEKFGPLYVAEKDGYVSFYHHSGDPIKQEGYGGRPFNLTLTDGSPVVLYGPWSSRAGQVNRIKGWHQVLDVSITDDPAVWERGHTFYAGHITLEKAIEACKYGVMEPPLEGFNQIGVALVREFDGDVTYQPILVKGRSRMGKVYSDGLSIPQGAVSINSEISAEQSAIVNL